MGTEGRKHFHVWIGSQNINCFFADLSLLMTSLFLNNVVIAEEGLMSLLHSVLMILSSVSEGGVTDR